MAHKFAFLSILLLLVGIVDMKGTRGAPVLYVTSPVNDSNIPIFLSCYVENGEQIARFNMNPNEEYKLQVKNTSNVVRCEFTRTRAGQFVNVVAYDRTQDNGRTAIYLTVDFDGASISYDNLNFSLKGQWKID